MDWQIFNQKLINLGYSASDREFVARAFSFAQEAHKGQKRDSGDPYFSHLSAVALEIANYKLDAETIAAALLHDTREDCEISANELERVFGAEVAFLVEGVTKLSTVRYHGVQRKIESLRKMFLAVAQDVRVVLIKLADRLHNMETIRFIRPDKQHRIALETLEIYAPIAYRLGMGALKGKLEDLSFPIVHPEEFAWIKKESDKRVPEGERYLEDEVRPLLTDAFQKEHITPFFIDARKKHLYSLWKKLLRYDMDMERMTDLLAMRIVVGNIEECYRVFGIIHQLWKPLPGRIKDYIALPKPNGYRSLHTTVFCVRNKVTEFQIRTKEMHDEAEHGVAAHWSYAETGKPKQGGAVGSRMEWVHALSDWQREVGSGESGDEFLESLKIDFFKDRIFVLTPKGEVIDLPVGATPVDFAYAIHTDIGNRMTGAKVNSKLVPFDKELSSGETIEILTQKNRKPNTEWLSFVKTSFAKNRIRAATRKNQNTAERPQKNQYQFTIAVENRVGILKDITTVFSAFRINIQRVAINDKNRAFPEIVITAPMRDTKQAESIATRLKPIQGIREVWFKR